MYCTKKITPDVVWVGGNDRRLAMFEGVYSVPTGVSYNSYLVLDEKTVLLDTVDRSVSQVFFENIEYLFAAGTDWVTTGIGRSLTAIPGHFGFAVLMGYYFSLNHFDKYRAPGAGLKMWLYPVLAHGLYDTVAMMATVTPQLSGAITIAILLFCFQMVKWARQGMKKHLIADASDFRMGGGVDIQG